MYEDFGSQLRLYRQARKMTQEGLAERGGIALRTLAYWEAGRHTPGIQEMDSIAEALALTPEERQELLALLPLGKVSKIVRAGSGWAGLAAPPGIGDLIRALRWRKCFSREQLADALGVHRATASRWEEGQIVPGAETRMRLCDALGASPEEGAVLMASSHTAPQWSETAPTLDACREEAARLERASGRQANPLFDLSAYLLTGTLWYMAARQPEARLLLARTYAARAVYSCVRGDDASALDYSSRSLRLLAGENAPPKAALYLALWASGCALTHRSAQSGSLQSLRQAKQWLRRLEPSETPALLLVAAGEWALQARLLPEAQHYWREANAQAERRADLSPYFYEGLQALRANTLVREGRYDEGLEAELQIQHASYLRPIMRKLFQTDVFLRMGARNDADTCLRCAYSLITAAEADTYKKEADALASQLEK